MKKIQTVLPIILLLLISFTQPLLAIEYGGIGGRPAYPDENNERTESIFIYESAPGTIEEDGIVVVNNTAETKTILVYATDTTPSSGGGFACKQYAEEVTDIGGWFKLEKNEVTLAAGKNEIIPFTVSIPSDISVGEHDACLVVQEKKEESADAGINLSVRAAIRAMILIPGDVIKKLDIESFSYVKSDNGKNLLNLEILNSGNVSIDAGIKITSVDFLTSRLFSQNEGTYTILHSNKQEFNFDLENNPWGGIYKANVEVKYNGNIGEEILTDDMIFVLMPSVYVLALYIVVLILVAVGTYIIGDSMNKRRLASKRAEKYVVKKGDTLESIAKERNLNWKLLAKINDKKAPYTILEGEELMVPEIAKRS